jgi:putative nucleotidyltransferase with HDIG domain
MWFLKKSSPRRNQVRKTIASDRFAQLSKLANPAAINSILIWLLFVVICIPILSFSLAEKIHFSQVIPTTVVVLLISTAAGFYICYYQGRIIKNHPRALALVGLFLLLLTITKLGFLLTNQLSWATATATAAAIILIIAYDQRFAIDMSIFYCLFAYFTVRPLTNINLFMIMAASAFACGFSLKEIRTRMKLIEVSTMAAAIVFITAAALGFLTNQTPPTVVLENAGLHAIATFLVGLLIQSLLPVIEKTFRIATSMTLLDHSDANQPLLKKLAMEAPGTFSHGLLVGSIAEASAEAIGRNGLLCRVGAYYHDIGKLNKPSYFVENEMGATSRHKELSPAMSQLIIIAHVKDGIEMAKEYGLPAVLRQFITTHHGTTLVEYFYHEAIKLKTKSLNQKADDAPSESEFRYNGPKPRTKEAAIVMLADTSEGAVRSLPEVTPTKIEAVVHNMAIKRLQDGQFDECDLSLRELSQIETAMAKALAAHHHGRIVYPTPPDQTEETPPTDN